MSFILTIFAWILAVILCLAVGLIIYARWNYGFLEGLGIPVVKPFLFLGSNYKEGYIDITKCDTERQEKYGGIYGVYDGRRPQIYVSDPKLIRLITTADFEHFQNHGWDFGAEGGSIFTNILDVLNDEKWRTVRGALTPVFTSGKLKQMIPIAKSIGEDYAETLLEQCEKNEEGRANGIRFREFIAPMIIEFLAKCFCGIEIPNAKDENNEFVRNMKMALFHDLPEEGWKEQVPKIFPVLLSLMPSFSLDGMDFFISAMKDILREREKSGLVSIDATSTLVDIMKKGRTDPTYKRLGINDDVALAQAWEFFGAGYSGLRDLFDFFMYEMAMNESIQEKVFKEITSVISHSEEVSLETVSRMPYLAACLAEVSRLHTSFHRLERLCGKDWSHEGLKIPNGTQIVFPTLAIHRNPEYWPNPNTFDPSRFLSENKESRNPYAYMAFGQGPRGCIGQRFSIEVSKILVVIFLIKFRIQKRSDTVCEAKRGGGFILSYKPLLVDVFKR